LEGLPETLRYRPFTYLPREAFLWDESLPYPKMNLSRLVLHIADPALEELDWETLLDETAKQIAYPAPTYRPIVIRSRPSRPRSLNLPFTLPLRILQLNP